MALRRRDDPAMFSVKTHERSLGIWWPRVLARHKGRLEYPVIKTLLTQIKNLGEIYVAHTRTDILQCDTLRTNSIEIFNHVGPRLWPTPQEDPEGRRFSWLADATVDTLDGLYPRNLYYSDLQDRKELLHIFYNMVIDKCGKRHPGWAPPQDHQFQHFHQQRQQTFSAETTSRSLTIEDDRSEEKDPPSTFNGSKYSPLSSTRARSNATTPNSVCVSVFAEGYRKRRRSGDSLHTCNSELDHDATSQHRLPSLIVVLKIAPLQLAGLTTHASEVQIEGSDEHLTTCGVQDESLVQQDVGQFTMQAAPSRQDQSSATPDLITPAHRPAITTFTGNIEQLADQYVLTRLARDILKAHYNSPTISLVLGAMLHCTIEKARQQLELIMKIVVAVPAARTSLDTLCTELQGIASGASVVVGSACPTTSAGPRSVDSCAGARPQDGRSSGHQSEDSPTSHASGQRTPPTSETEVRLDDDLLTILGRVDAEIVWDSNNEPRGVPCLEWCRSAEDLFTQLDEQRPPRMQHQVVDAVRVERINNYGSGQMVSFRIARSHGVEAFHNLMRRLKEVSTEKEVKLELTVDWK
ncbi:hypothetical protein LTR56_016167 [Elasticomyces elasticus]|nr:hypothetical protein LTR56_016167 [Elasticomyces elasticus]KAK3642126.1 hypothetical protein LTR22_016247 [Elasticomyces elasticus]KAK4914174.1 hypothetical protein LTR49_017527 [Elasticomyces elasticus]KAK5762535.1 hypothetical protein LTS12_007326 [Elasticomyces elasticus]